MNTNKTKPIFKILKGLQKQPSPSITKDEAIEMLAQHLITRPVFEALFENYSFVKDNPISQSMQRILEILDDKAVNKSQDEVLGKFYREIKNRVEGINNQEGKQKVILELYDKFFKTALPKTVEKLGIVYTPVEVVDFIINSVSDVLKKEFNRTLSYENSHILDPFTGTGTFTTRLKFKNKEDKSEIIYNNSIRITNIPKDAYDYIVNGRSAIEWVMERYQVKIDKASQIKNDPDDWAKEHNQPRYILDLLLSVISLSAAAVRIINSLPKLTFEEVKETVGAK